VQYGEDNQAKHGREEQAPELPCGSPRVDKSKDECSNRTEGQYNPGRIVVDPNDDGR
jgi:hypothetical protein